MAVIDSPEAARTHYTRAIALTEAVRADLRAFDKGPYARPNPVERFLLSGGTFTSIGAVLTGVVSFMSGIGTVAMLGEGGPLVAGAAIAVSSGLTSYFLGYADKRANRTIETKKSLPIDHAELGHMLEKWTAATPEERAILAPVVEAELLAFDVNLSPKAAIMRERLLAELPALDADSVEGRASKVALVVNNLLNSQGFDAQLKIIESVLHAATPTERAEVAKVLETALFEGEQPKFAANADQQRSLYRAIAAGYRGESPQQGLLAAPSQAEPSELPLPYPLPEHVTGPSTRWY